MPLSLVTLTALIGAAVGQALPEPTDSTYFFITQWLAQYGTRLDPWFARFVELWSFYMFSATWYLFLICLILQFRKNGWKRKMQMILKVLTVAAIVWVALYWIGAPTLYTMSYESGLYIIAGSSILFGVFALFILWKLRQSHTQVQVGFR